MHFLFIAEACNFGLGIKACFLATNADFLKRNSNSFTTSINIKKIYYKSFKLGPSSFNLQTANLLSTLGRWLTADFLKQQG